jgi:hypothetical protein
MYKIIGADGKEYGPISADQMRQWISEGRVNGQTMVLLEGTADWKPLAQFPELASSLAIAPVPAPQPGPSPFSGAPADNAAQLVNGPATGLMVVAIIGFVLQLVNLFGRSFIQSLAARQGGGEQPFGNMFSGAIGVAGAVIGLVTAGVILFGALKMKKLENYALAMVASVIVMVPCVSPCCLLGIPAGIWALITLNKPEVKSAFH